MSVRLRGRGRIRVPVLQPDTVVVRVTITSVAPGTFAPTDTHQLSYTAYNTGGGIIGSPTTVVFARLSGTAASIDASTGVVTASTDGTAVMSVTVDGVAAENPVTYTVSTPIATVTQVIVTGPTSVQEGNQIVLTAEPRTAGGTPVLGRTVTWSEVSGAGDVTLSADSGTDPHNVTVTGVTDGSRLVKATCDAVDSSNYTLTITNPPAPPGSYDTIAAQYWYDYTDKTQLAGMVGTESSFHSTRKPVLPVTDFYDLVSMSAPDVDGVIATRNVLRYNGGVALNSWPVVVRAKTAGSAGNSIRVTDSAGTSSGRKWVVTDDPTSPTITETYDNQTRATLLAAIASSALIEIDSATFNDLGVTLPGTGTNVRALTGGGIGVKASFQFVDNISGRTAVHSATYAAMDNLYTRTFIKFSSNWTTASAIGGQGAASHKLLFHRNAVSRTEFEIDGARGWQDSPGAPQGGGTVVVTTLPHHNVVSMNTQYSASGFPYADLYNDTNDTTDNGTFKMMKAACPGPNLGSAICGAGSEEWFEVITHDQYNNSSPGNILTRTQAIRQLTQGGVNNPLPWRSQAKDHAAPAGSTWQFSTRYEHGINRNRQWDETMYWYSALYQCVDGDLYPDPWGVGI